MMNFLTSIGNFSGRKGNKIRKRNNKKQKNITFRRTVLRSISAVRYKFDSVFLSAYSLRHFDTDWHSVARIVDRKLGRILNYSSLWRISESRAEINFLESIMDVAAYVGYRRADFISSTELLPIISGALKHERYLRSGRLNSVEYRHLLIMLGICRTRFDSVERHEYAKLAELILGVIERRGGNHIALNDVYSIVKRFLYPNRLLFVNDDILRMHCIGLAKRQMTRAMRQVKPIPLDRVPKLAALSIAVGNNKYPVRLMLDLRDKTIYGNRPAASRAMVDLAFLAGMDSHYGEIHKVFKPLLQRTPGKRAGHRLVSIASFNFGRYDDAFAELESLSPAERNRLPTQFFEGRILKYLGRFEESELVFKNVKTTAVRRYCLNPKKVQFSMWQFFSTLRMLDELSYIKEFDSVLLDSKRSRQKFRSDLIVLCPSSFYNFHQLPLPILARSVSRGARLISLMAGYIRSDSVDTEVDCNVTDSISPRGSDRVATDDKLDDKWVIDFKNRNVDFCGVNFYYGLHNTLGIIFRSYDIDWNDMVVQGYVKKYLRMFQAITHKIDDLISYADRSGANIKFVVAEIQHGISYAIRRIAEARGRSDVVEVFHVGNSLEGYHVNLPPTAHARFMSILNMTRYPEGSLAYRPPSRLFDNWYLHASEARRNAPDILGYVKKVEGGRSKGLGDVVAECKRARRNGQRVVVILGKILADFARPEDFGYIHSDIAEWIADTARIAWENDVKLVLKPHPDEVNPKMCLYVNQFFEDLFKRVPEEIRPSVLGHKDTNLHDLRDICDGVVLWAGNSPIELALLRVPTMICGVHGTSDCPVGHPIPLSRENYVDFICGRGSHPPLEQIREKTIAYLSYIRDEAHTIPMDYNNRSKDNAENWPPVFNKEFVSVAANGQNEHVERVCDYLLDGRDCIIPSVD